ncbi:MAG TPA: polymorphic toxin-type HINT domain-containing protein [Polyangiaceae bacterium]
MTGRGGAGAYPTTSFQYGQTSPPQVQALSSLAGWKLNDRGVSFLDVDGDGLPDLAHMELGSQSYLKNLGGGAFAPEQPLQGAESMALDNVRMVDLTGDAHPELLTQVDNTWRWMTLEGATFTYQGIWNNTLGIPMGDAQSVLADVNGDGRTDVIQGLTTSTAVYLNGASGLDAGTQHPMIDPTNASVVPGDPDTRFHDINGDGLVDATWVADIGMQSYLGQGDGTFVSLAPQSWPWGEAAIDHTNILFADLNKDGLLDLIRTTDGTVEWYLGRPGFTFDAAPVTVPRPDSAGDEDVVVTVQDVYGTGTQAVVWSSSNGMWALQLAGTASAGMLTGIQNGLGKTLSFTYSTSAVQCAAAAAAGKPWQSLLPTSVPVPLSMTESTGAGDPDRTMRYTVRDGFWDGVERRFGGFLSASNQATAPVAARIDTTYEPGNGNRRVLRGDPLTVSTYDDHGKLVLQKLYTRDTLALPGLAANPLSRRPIVLQEDDVHYEGVTTPITVRETYAHDAQGNVSQENRLGRLDVTGDEATHASTYASDDTLWVRDKLLTSSVLDATGKVLQSTRTTYGDNANLLPLGQVGKGWVRKTESLLVDPTRGQVWRLDEQMNYDAVGHVVQHYDGAVWHQRAYDPNGMFVVQESVTSGGRVIATSATWDPVLGVPLSVTGANGETGYNTYDALGRLVSRAHKPGLPYELFTYNWIAPRPWTTTDLYEGREDTLAPFTAWAPGTGWRESTVVTNGSGEQLFAATRLGASALIVDDWSVRDTLGRVVFKGEPFQTASTTLPTAAPAGLKGHSYVFDAIGRTAAVTLPTGAARRSQFAAFTVTTTTDGISPVTTQIDGLDRATHTERTVGTTTEKVDAVFDAAGTISRISLQGGLVNHTFSYDSLGRLVGTADPDNGARTLAYNDFDQLVSQTNGAGQTVHYAYDDVGRVTSTSTSDGRSFNYHYDVAKDGASPVRALGRVAWIEEPTGEVDFAYDAEGRVAKRRRSVKGRSIEEMPRYSPEGKVLGVTFDDGFTYDVTDDDAGRAVKVGDFWSAVSLDARGGIVQEQFGNGIVGTFQRDDLGQPTHLRIARPSGAALYDVGVQRNAFGGIATATDGDGVGLNHTASFGYDGAGRLTSATLGPATTPFTFAYAYDGLQNLTSRTAAGPRAIQAITGTYTYGESGASPRQLTSVSGASGKTTFAYDKAGRMVQNGTTTLAYNEFDELMTVTAKGPVPMASHDYGYDGIRTWTSNADGTQEVWFSTSVTEKNGNREHTIEVEGRTIAKVSAPITSLPAPDLGALASSTSGGTTAGSDAGATSHAAPSSGAAATLFFGSLLAFAASLLALASPRRRRWVPALALGAMVGLVACGSRGGGENEDVRSTASAWTAGDIRTYFHQGFAAGPVLFTRADASVEEERLYEPFGEPIEAYRETGGTQSKSSIGDVDFHAESRNELNSDTDFNTGLSYHGARWMAPALAHWLTPDPPTKAPDPKFLLAPWDMNPYAFVRGNPLVYWDADGRNWTSFAKGFVIGAAKAAVTAAVIAAVVTAAPVLAPAIAVASAAATAYSAYQAYQNRGEIVAMGQRVLSGTTTDADHEAMGEVLGGIVGGKIGGAVGVRVGGAVRQALPSVPKPGPGAPPKAPSVARCFAAGTLVLTEDGEQPIETIHEHDRVWAVDQQTGDTSLQEVTATFITPDMPLVELEVSSNGTGIDVLRATPTHLFWVEGRGWTRLDHVAPGDALLDAGANPLRVVALRPLGELSAVYNLTVANSHTYFVGHAAVLVHNETRNADGSMTMPELPAREVASESGVRIQHFYHGGDHAEAHLHVYGGGDNTKIGMNGKPIKGQPELSSRQQEVVGNNKATIRRVVDKIQRWHRFNENVRKGSGGDGCG